MSEIEFGIHWLSFTVHAPDKAAGELYSALFENLFGPMLSKGHGGRGYRSISSGFLELKIYTTPINDLQRHFHFEIPGEGCEYIPASRLNDLLDYLEKFHAGKYNFKRIDLAFDNCQFTPQQAQEAIQNDQIRTLAKRSTFKVHQSPFEVRKDGGQGTHTVELGSEKSDRKITIYNKRGFTRLEFQIKDDRAQAVGIELFSQPDNEAWFALSLAHLRDFIDFQTDWWGEFVGSVGRARLELSNPREASVEKITGWLDYQVSPSLSVMQDLYGNDFMDKLIKRGRKKRGKRFDFLFPKKDDGEE